MKAAVIASLMAPAAAFVAPNALLKAAPAKTKATSRGLSMEYNPYLEEIPGAPFGPGSIFDPLGLSAKCTVAEIRKYREAELKHGRLCMLGSVGVIIQEVFHPFFLTRSDVGPSIFHFQEIQARFPVFWLATLLAIGIVEGETLSKGWTKLGEVDGIADLKDDYIEGDLDLDPLKVKEDPEKFLEYRTKELNNGRLAMIAFSGQIAQELVDKQGVLAHLGLA